MRNDPAKVRISGQPDGSMARTPFPRRTRAGTGAFPPGLLEVGGAQVSGVGADVGVRAGGGCSAEASGRGWVPWGGVPAVAGVVLSAGQVR